jgi:hypothetical protein
MPKRIGLRARFELTAKGGPAAALHASAHIYGGPRIRSAALHATGHIHGAARIR